MSVRVPAVCVRGWASVCVCLHRSPENDKQIIKLHFYANRGTYIKPERVLGTRYKFALQRDVFQFYVFIFFLSFHRFRDADYAVRTLSRAMAFCESDEFIHIRALA